MRPVLLSLVLLVSLAMPVCMAGAPGRVIVVPRDYPDIAGAVEAAEPGTIIIVEPGVYSGPVTLYGVYSVTICGAGAVLNGSLRIVSSANIVIRGLTVWSGGDAVYIHGSRGIVLENMSIDAGRGGVLVYGSHNITMEYIAVEAVYPVVIDSSDNISITSPVLMGKRNALVIYGSRGVVVAGGEIRGWNGVVVRRNSVATLRGLRVTAGEHGVYVDSSTVYIHGCRVEGSGSGVSVPKVSRWSSAPVHVVYINGSVFTGNTYGVYVAPAPVRLTIENSVFDNNTYGVYAEYILDAYIGDSVFRGNRYAVTLRHFIGSYITYPDKLYYLNALNTLIDTGRAGYKTDPFPKYVNYWLRTLKGNMFTGNHIALSLEHAAAYVSNNVFRNNTYALRLRDAWRSMITLNVFLDNDAVAAPGTNIPYICSYYPVPYAYRGRYRFRVLGNYYGVGGVDADGDGVIDKPLRLTGVNGTVSYDPAALTEPPENYVYPLLFGNTTITVNGDIHIRQDLGIGYGELLIYYSGYGAEELVIVLEAKKGLLLYIEGLKDIPFPNGHGYRILLGKVGLYVFHIVARSDTWENQSTSIVIVGSGGETLYSGMINIYNEGTENPPPMPMRRGHGDIGHVFDPVGPAPYVLFIIISLVMLYAHRAATRKFREAMIV